MANERNLKTPTAAEAREKGRKGGLASGKARRERKTLREELLYLLETEKEVANGEKKALREIISIGLIKRAAEGDPQAYKTIRDTIGEDVVAKIDVTSNGKPIQTTAASFNVVVDKDAAAIITSAGKCSINNTDSEE